MRARPALRLVPALPALVLLLALAAPAAAHSLKVFATVEAGTVSGYGFFIGGGRAADSTVTARDGAGATVHEGTTDAEGRFSFTPAAPIEGDLTVTIDSGGGHMGTITLDAARFGPAPAPAPDPEPIPAEAPADVARPPAPDPEALAALIEHRVEVAVARQIRPLLEAQAEAEARIRLRDVVGGLGMIAGLVGFGLWAYGRRHPPPPR